MTDPAPRWLDDGEMETWSALAALVIRLPAALDAQLRRDSGLSHFEYQVMAGLSESSSRTMRMSILAALADGSLSRLSQVIAKLERRGWVTRAPDPSDGRFTLATLTNAGYAQVVDAAPGHVETVRRLVLDPLTKAQQRQLGQISRRVLDAVDPDSPIPRRPGEVC